MKKSITTVLKEYLKYESGIYLVKAWYNPNHSQVAVKKNSDQSIRRIAQQMGLIVMIQLAVVGCTLVSYTYTID